MISTKNIVPDTNIQINVQNEEWENEIWITFGDNSSPGLIQ